MRRSSMRLNKKARRDNRRAFLAHYLFNVSLHQPASSLSRYKPQESTSVLRVLPLWVLEQAKQLRWNCYCCRRQSALSSHQKTLSYLFLKNCGSALCSQQRSTDFRKGTGSPILECRCTNAGKGKTARYQNHC